MIEGAIAGGIFAVFTRSPGAGPLFATTRRPVPSLDHPTAAAHATAAAGRLIALDEAGALRLARTAADLDAAHEQPRRPAAVLHLEGAEAIDADLEALDMWHAAGLRSLGPVWSRPNAFGHGVPFAFPSSPDIGPGLTEAGRNLVRRCGEKGILIDVSHLNEAGFWDVARIDAGPLVASHSGVHALSPASRNLTDRQLQRIGASHGLVGVVFACPFLRSDCADDENTPVATVAKHVRYVADRIGVEHVAFGSDFDGARVPREIADATGMPRVLAALADAGFTAAEIAQIAWGNWRRVLAAAWS